MSMPETYPIVDVLVELFKSKRAVVGVIGLGYVGLPIALAYEQCGYQVCGIDSDKEKVEGLRSGKSPITSVPSPDLASALSNGLKVTSDYSCLAACDAVIICVPTPLNVDGSPDITSIVSAVNSCASFIKKGQVISLESTTYPGTTSDIVLPLLQRGGLRVGSDFFLVYSPERIDPGNLNYGVRNIPKIVSWATKECLAMADALYGTVINQLVLTSSFEVAELAKLLENVYRTVNIGLVNEFKAVAEALNINIFEVIEAASSKPFGFSPHFPGPGIGGHCLPIDSGYFSWKAKQLGSNAMITDAAIAINSYMPNRIVSRICQKLREHNRSLKGCSVLLLGISYKKNIDDMRESPSLKLLTQLQEFGAHVSFSDPHVESVVIGHDKQEVSPVILTAESIYKFDIVIIATDHDVFDYELIVSSSNLLVDCRGRVSIDAKNVLRV